MTKKSIRGIFFTGLITALPIVATVYLVIWLVTSLESLLGSMLRYVLAEGSYVPGMGLAIGIVCVFLIGLAMQAWLGRELWSIGEKLVRRMPGVSQIFGALKEVVSYIGGSEQPRADSVVVVNLGEPPMRMLGLVTREELEFLPEHCRDERVAVFLPMSYQIGGFTVFVARSALEPVELTPQEALRLSLTAGVAKQASDRR